MRTIFETIGAFFQWTFEFIAILSNLPNLLFFVILVIAFCYWMIRLKKFENSGSRFDKYISTPRQ